MFNKILITIGAPINDVMILIGKVPNGNKSVKIENNNIIHTPANNTQRNNKRIFPVFKTDLQMCGTANPTKAIGPVNAVADAVNKAAETNIKILNFLMSIPTDCAYFSPSIKAEIPLKVNIEPINPKLTNNANTPTCSHDNPLIEPNPHIKNVLILSEVEKYCINPINATVNPDNINPRITNEADDLTLFKNRSIKNKAKIEPIKDANIKSHGLFNHVSNPNVVNRKTTIATPKLAIDVTPNTDGSAKGFLNNSCIKNPAIGNDRPIKTAVILLGNLKFNTKLRFTSSVEPIISLIGISTFPIVKL